MSDFSDRMLVMVIAATTFGTLIVWWGGLVRGETGGIVEMGFGGLLIVIFLAAMLLVWTSAKKSE